MAAKATIGGPGAPGPHPVWRREPRVLWRGVGEGVVLLAPGSADSVTLSASAGRLWAHLAHPLTTAQLVERLAAEYSVDAASISDDVADAVGLLAQQHALVAVESSPADGGDR